MTVQTYYMVLWHGGYLLCKQLHLPGVMSFPKNRDKFTVGDLMKLSLALGMPKKTLTQCFKCKTDISVRSIQDMLRSKKINQELHRTYNMYNAEYNINVILKAVDCLTNRILSFNEINEIRYVFEVYEIEDLKGILNCEHIINRILKLCGRAIAPLKLQHQLKKMRDYVDVVGRLQLYEFLEIIPYTTLLKRINVTRKLQGSTLKDSQKLYELDDFLEILATDDERIRDKLEKDYRNVLHKSFDVSYTFKSKGGPRMIYTEEQYAKEQSDKNEFSRLKKLLKQSSNVVITSKNSHTIQPFSTPPVEKSESSSSVQLPELSHTSAMTRIVSTNPIVTASDVHRQDSLIKGLQWDIINHEEKYRQLMEDKLEEIKGKKKFRENRNITTIYIPSTAYGRKDTRPSTINDSMGAFSRSSTFNNTQDAPSRPVSISDTRAVPSRPVSINDTFRVASCPGTINDTRGDITRPRTINSLVVTDSEEEEEEETPRTVCSPQNERVVKPRVKVPLGSSYEYRKKIILEKVKLVKAGKRLIDI